MAKQTIVHVTDDLGDGTADTTVRFSVNGASYEIDLSKKNAKAFAEAIEVYVAAARRISGPARKAPAKAVSRRSATSVKRNADLDLTAVRHWAAQAGHKIADRGRISAVVIEAFHAAQGAAASVVAPEPAAAPAAKVPAKKVARRPAAKSTPTKKSPRRAPAKKAAAKPVATAPAAATESAPASA
jgi:hypothetical protein